MINIVELFSGIGSQAKAFERLSKKHNVDIKIVNTCEWDIHAMVAYDYIHYGSDLLPQAKEISRDELLSFLSKKSLSNDGKNPIKERTLELLPDIALRHIYSSINRTNNLISINDVRGEDIPNNLTVLTYSFPCQDLSNVGCIHGFKHGIDRNAHTRSGLLWEVERILLERQKQQLDMPKFLLLENVTALEAERHKDNFDDWKNTLERLGYVNHINRLYAPDFGIPQNRKRLLMLSVYVGDDNEKRDIVNNYFKKNDLNDPNYLKSLNINKPNLETFLKTDYDNEIFFKEAIMCQPNDTPSRETIWDKNLKIIDENGAISKIVQTITTKQDRHPNSGNLFFKNGINKSNYRFLTPRECFTLMGFDEKDYEILVNNNFESRKNSLFFSRDRLYKLAGNSIVVNMLESIFEQVLELIDLFEIE